MLRLDFFPKFIDNAMIKKTNFGAIISILMVVTAATLCLSETKNFLRPATKEQLVSVSDLRGTLSELVISFNFTVSVPCVLLHLDVFDIMGVSNDQAKKSLTKVRIDQNGKPIVSKTTPPKCGSCYGAKRKCCNSCEEIVTAYQEDTWGIENFANWTQCIDEDIKLDGTERCRAFGSLNVNAIEGGFHLAPGINVINQFGHQHDMSPFGNNLNLSHEIDHLTLGASFGQSPLDNTRVIQNKVGKFHYRYNLKAVPTVVTTPNGKTTRGFQYTVNFAEIPVNYRGRFGPGIFIIYNFAPVAVVSSPDRSSFPIFIARCVSIIGGTFMLGRLIDSFGYRLNTLEGKMRIGKAE
ncbi:hypothetical protein TRFO_00821 [Tritrichomonas foetus]|uniref:Endoplasmic reticulum-Golgi intermediate compartment protein 3 n=1 Tax=Tritrichomonas foetus TaxID=1144522 RepID=A0A1J4L6K2_9EUKA|nr:hypothetical protein TRFO_00821 [Tritrichomonas foetus]|eukprot:OHT17574.1 hypothetical protein TRFO_00821 [Tritrichomonas foetus]